MHRTFTSVVATLALAFALGCQKAETDYDPYANFSTFKTFAWETGQSTAENEAARDFPHLLDEVRTAIGAVLETRGLHPAAATNADLLLQAHLELATYSTAPDANADGQTDMPSQKLGPLVLAPYSVTQVENVELNRELQEGTLLLNMRARTTGQPVWQGWVRRVIDVSNLRDVEWAREPDAGDVRYRQRIVGRAVDRLLADFPPEPAVRLSANGQRPE